MLTSLHLKKFRRFKSFRMSSLGRVNLLVGENHSGKTTILDSIYLLKNQNEPLAMWDLCRKRGVLNHQRIRVRESRITADICHLFRGHEIAQGTEFKLSATDQNNESESLHATIEIMELDPLARTTLNINDLLSGFALQMSGSAELKPHLFPLNIAGALNLSAATDKTDKGDFFSELSHKLSCSTTQYLTTNPLDIEHLNALWDQAILTSQEDFVLRYLHCLDSKIERIELQKEARKDVDFSARSGILVKKKGFKYPIPIGTLGDGIWRLLSLAMTFSRCRNGVLLIDEIDSGLHPRSLAKIWKLIFRAARELDAQVFATTHSWDCVKAFGQIRDEEGIGLEENDGLPCASLQRVEKGRPHAVSYTLEEVQRAAENLMEVR